MTCRDSADKAGAAAGSVCELQFRVGERNNNLWSIEDDKLYFFPLKLFVTEQSEHITPTAALGWNGLSLPLSLKIQIPGFQMNPLGTQFGAEDYTAPWLSGSLASKGGEPGMAAQPGRGDCC